MCLGKAMTAGYLPMSAAIVTDRIYDAFRNDGAKDRTFYDGHTFCGNPITAAAAIETLNIFAEERIVERTLPLHLRLHEGFEQISHHSTVSYYKCSGMIAMCELTNISGGAVRAKKVARKAMELGLFIRPLGDILYLWPPLTVSMDELNEMLRLFKLALDQTIGMADPPTDAHLS